jgi:hypothetical protein
MEIPTARVMKRHSYRVGIGQVSPYRYYFGAISPFNGLEIDGRVTEFLDREFAQQKTSKDKAVDVKFQFYPEGKYMPALAIGIMDPHGTRIFASQYIVASKQIYPFDFTIGFGNGRFGKRPLVARTENVKVEMFSDTRDWLRDSQLFWGIQFTPSERLAMMFEYNPVRYHEQTPDPERAIRFREPVPSKYNVGIRYKPAEWIDIILSYQRGNRFGLQVSTAFDIGNTLIPILDIPYRESVIDSQRSLERRIVKALSWSGFEDIGVYREGDDIWIEAENGRYFFLTRAVGVALRTIAGIVPDDVRRVHLILKENGIGLVEFIASREDIDDLYSGRMSVNEFYALSTVKTGKASLKVDKVWERKSVKYGFAPSLETLLNDPAGFFKYRFGVKGWIDYHPWAGGTFHAGVETYPLNNFETSNEPLSVPVRSDLVLYKKEKLQLGRLLFDQVVKLDGGLYGKISAGLLEIEYAGVDAEVARPFFDGRLLVGISGSAVKKRAPDELFRMKPDPVKRVFTTAFINSRLNLPELDMSLDVKAGRFLAGDVGARFTVSKFIKGVVLSAWYSFTDTSVFNDRYNDGYHDKGISVSIPVRIFAGVDSKRAFRYSLAPWTRDTGQDIDHFGTLFDFIGRNLKIFIDKDMKKIYK